MGEALLHHQFATTGPAQFQLRFQRGLDIPPTLLHFSGGSAIFRAAVHRAMVCGGAPNSAEMVTLLGVSR